MTTFTLHSGCPLARAAVTSSKGQTVRRLGSVRQVFIGRATAEQVSKLIGMQSQKRLPFRVRPRVPERCWGPIIRRFEIPQYLALCTTSRRLRGREPFFEPWDLETRSAQKTRISDLWESRRVYSTLATTRDPTVLPADAEA